MNKCFTIFTLILFSYSLSWSQIVWQQHFETVEMDVLSIANFKDGEIVDVAGLKNEQPFSMSLNKKKEISVNNNFQNKIPFLADFIYPLSESKYIIGSNSNKGFQYEVINRLGQSLWKKTFNTTAKINAVCDIKSGGLVVVGTDEKKMFAARLDNKGQVLWKQTFGGSGELLDVVETGKGSLLMVGYVDLFLSGETDFFITQITSEGKNEWEKVLGEPEHLNEKAHLVSITANKQIIIVGNREDNIWMMQLAQNQEVTWEKEIKEKNYKFEPTALYSQANGMTFLAASSSSPTQSPHLYMVQLNSYLMTSGNDLIGKFRLEPFTRGLRKSLSVNYKASNRYYQVTSDIKEFKGLQLLGRYPNGYDVHLLGVNKKGQVEILSFKSSDASLRQITALIDTQKHQYLILLVCNYEINIQELKKRLEYKNDMIEGFVEIFKKQIISKENISYKPYEITAYGLLGMEGIVPFFIRLE